MIDTELYYSDEQFGSGVRMIRPHLGFEEDEDGVESFDLGGPRRPPPGPPGRAPPRMPDNNDRIGRLRTHPDDSINPFTVKELTDEQYMICSPGIWGFVTKLRSWGTYILLECVLC